MTNILVLRGTNRPGNKSQRVAAFLESYLASLEDVEVKLVATSDFDISVDGNDEEHKSTEYTDLISWMDAMIIISPEYNHSFPGSLKSLLDKELKTYNHKAVGLVGVSSGMFGGARVIEHLTPVVRELGLTLSHTALHIQKAGQSFSEDGTTDDEAVKERTAGFVSELLWVAKSLKWGRENLS